MSKKFHYFQRRVNLFNQGLDRILFVISVYALPIFIGFVSLLAFFAWQVQFPYADPSPLEIQAVSATKSPVDLPDAIQRLAGSTAVGFYDTHLSEVPTWLSFTVPAELNSPSLMIEFPSRHATGITCWDAESMTLLGSGDRVTSSGAISPKKAGFALEINPKSRVKQVVCNTSAVGPARLTAIAWPTDMLMMSNHDFYRKSGLLDGGIVVLTLFVLITALINRRALYVLFAAWLLVNLRMAALSAGWDSQWMGSTVPLGWLSRSRSITLALYYLLTVTLFFELFQEDLKKVGSLLSLRIAQWTCIPLLLASILLTYQSFLPLV